MTEETKKLKAADLVKDLPESVKQLDAVRAGSNSALPLEISFSEYLQQRYGITQSDYLSKLNISTKVSTMQNIFSMPDPNYRWLVPEIIREAINLGMTQAPMYPSLIASDQPINGLSAIMPFINPSDATPAKVEQGETIPLGTVSFGQKSVNLFKIGKGFKLTDEVRNYVSLDVLSIFVSDLGKQLGYAMDNLLLDVLVNGNKADGSEAAPVIGVKTTGAIAYKDLLKLWVRGGRLGRNFTTIVGGEDIAVDMLDLPEFKDRKSGTADATLSLKSPVPRNADFFIHGSIDSDQILLTDPSAAAIKLTAQNLKLESERIVSNQTSAIYTTITTGFSKMYLDAAILMDKGVAFTAFPSILNVDSFLDYNI